VPGHPVQNLAGGEEQLLRAPAGAYLVPADRRGDGGVRPGPQRVGRDGGLGPVVLAPVDQDLAGPQRLGHPRHDAGRLLAFESFGEGPGLVAGLIGGHAGDPCVQLQPLPARRLGQRREALGLQQRPQPLRHPAAVHDVGGRPGIQVEHQQVRPPDVGHPPLRDVQLEAGQVGRPDQRGQVVHHQVGHVAAAPSRARRREPGGADPVRAVGGDVLLEERLPVDALRVALERQRPAGDVRQQHRRDPLVVVEHLGLGEPGGRVQHLAQVGQRQRPALHADRDLGLMTHGIFRSPQGA
jgi:hypothetical protein